MEYREIAPGVQVPVLGIGTWHMGEKRGEKEREVRTIKTAVARGMTHIDTAEMYASGGAEEVVGEAISGYDRGRLFITTKAPPSHFAYDDLIGACKGSLGRLGLEYVDLYLLHWPSHSVHLRETMRALDWLVKHGLTRFIGVSNFSVNLMQEAQGYTKNKIVTNQVEYNLIELEPERELLPYCQKETVLLTAYRPLAQGELTKRGFNKVLDLICDKYRKTPAQVALNYLICQEGVVTIPKSSNLFHLEENLGALGWHLEDKDRESLKEI